jgi:hypothetical protein
MKYLLIDIDHTLSDAFWRDGMIGSTSWDEYHTASQYDKPFDVMVDMVDALRSKFTIVGITARPEKWRAASLKWMIDHGIYLDELLMRPDEAFHPAPEIKIRLVQERFKESLLDEAVCIIDDRDDVIAAFRGIGIKIALQCFAKEQPND